MTGRPFSLDRLESRWLLNGSAASMASGATTYINGVSWNASQNTLTVDFNQPGLEWYLQPGDILLEPANPNTPAPLLQDETWVDTSTDTFAPYQVSNPPLVPGAYDIVLQDDYNTEQVWSMNGPVRLGELTIVPAPVAPNLSTATPLGTIGTHMQSLSGSLDLSTQENVNLYEITLAPGHVWRLGVQLQAQQIGSPLQGALSLFDSNGTVVATANYGAEGLDSPPDPYLFSGLNPGVYYIGVSGAGNLAGQPGGYDPSGFGNFGKSGVQQPGGNYTLDLFADPADTPTQVIGAQLQWGDPLGTSPTGLVLSFSGSIDINSLNSNNSSQPAFWLVDQSGHTWNVVPASYNASQAQITLAFAQPLPPGEYALYNSWSNGLTDLAGWVPVAPGLPPGVLATWTVSPRTAAAVPGDLGTVWPSQPDGVSNSELILPGQSVTSQVFVPVEGLYTLQTSVPQGSLAVEQAGPGGLVVVDPGSEATSQQYTLVLQPGAYIFSFANLGTQETLATWGIKPSIIDHETLTDNGVGQSVALGLH